MTYSQMAKQKLAAAGAGEGDMVQIGKGEARHSGVLMPHHAFSDPDVVVVKVKSGYNLGIRLEESSSVEVVEKALERHPRARRTGEGRGRKVALLGTGGTIASYVDYRTGAVHAALSAEDLAATVPELSEICDIRAKVVFSIFSEDLDPAAWRTLAAEVASAVDDGAEGVIIPHGTDTMSYTAAALSFMLQDIPVPVALVGAQRSSDRPSSDAYLNLLAAARFVSQADASGVFVVMHHSSSDADAAVHIGTKARKMHTSRRDAFQSINCGLAGTIGHEGEVRMDPRVRRRGGRLKLRSGMDENVALVHFYPGMRPEALAAMIGECSGCVIAGTGLGHVSHRLIPVLAAAVRSGKPVVLASQCLHGRVNLNVYDTGRDLISAGCMPAEDMLPETAWVKLMWAMGQTRDEGELRELMAADLCGEISWRRDVDA
jgi:glutamyl-tRNA(Gln) amidotransferase subunit D